MLEKLAAIEARYDELEALMSSSDVMSDHNKIREYSQERSGLDDIVRAYHDYKRQLQELEEARELANSESDLDLRAMAEEEATTLQASTDALYERLKLLLLPSDPRDEKNVIMEVRAGAGGDEAGLFAADLYRMYSYYAQERGWKIEVIDQHETGVNGFKEIKFEVRGRGAFSRLKWESGVHRVQRVPEER